MTSYILMFGIYVILSLVLVGIGFLFQFQRSVVYKLVVASLKWKSRTWPYNTLQSITEFALLNSDSRVCCFSLFRTNHNCLKDVMVLFMNFQIQFRCNPI